MAKWVVTPLYSTYLYLPNHWLTSSLVSSQLTHPGKATKIEQCLGKSELPKKCLARIRPGVWQIIGQNCFRFRSRRSHAKIKKITRFWHAVLGKPTMTRCCTRCRACLDVHRGFSPLQSPRMELEGMRWISSFFKSHIPLRTCPRQSWRLWLGGHLVPLRLCPEALFSYKVAEKSLSTIELGVMIRSGGFRRPFKDAVNSFMAFQMIA